MLKSEFDNLIETRKPTDAEYNMIETVYMHHPAIDDVHGKMQIAKIWDVGGIMVIEDMLERAEAIIELEEEVEYSRQRYDAAKKRLESALHNEPIND